MARCRTWDLPVPHAPSSFAVAPHCTSVEETNRKDIIRDFGAMKDPNFHTSVFDPFKCKDSTLGVVERDTKVTLLGCNRTFPLFLQRSMNIAVASQLAMGRLGPAAPEFTRIRRNMTPIPSPQRLIVCFFSIDAFEDIDFTIVWPTGTPKPPSWPCPGASGNVFQIEDKKTLIEEQLGVESD